MNIHKVSLIPQSLVGWQTSQYGTAKEIVIITKLVFLYQRQIIHCQIYIGRWVIHLGWSIHPREINWLSINQVFRPVFGQNRIWLIPLNLCKRFISYINSATIGLPVLQFDYTGHPNKFFAKWPMAFEHFNNKYMNGHNMVCNAKLV